MTPEERVEWLMANLDPDNARETLLDHFRAAVAAERERCARVCETTEPEGDYVCRGEDGGSVWESNAERSLAEAARLIRAGEPATGKGCTRTP